MPDFKYIEAQCMFEGGLNRFLYMDDNRVASKCSGDADWTIEVIGLTEHAEYVIRHQAEQKAAAADLQRELDARTLERKMTKKGAEISEKLAGVPYPHWERGLVADLCGCPPAPAVAERGSAGGGNWWGTLRAAFKRAGGSANMSRRG